jgi:hypothetical protein
MGVVDWMKHHWWWISIPATLALERLLAYLTSIDLLGAFWKTAGPALRVDLTLPVWALAAVVAPLLMAISWLYRKRSQLSQSLAVATTELEALKQPKPPAPITLSSVQEKVLFWTVVIYDVQKGAGAIPMLLANVTNYPLTVVETALDALVQKGLVKTRGVNLAPVELTPEGRSYIGSEAVFPRYTQFSDSAANDL